MRKLKWLSLAVLFASVIYFVFYNIQAWRSRDLEGPVITMSEEQIYVSVQDDESVLLNGVTAEDAKDGDVTSSLVVESISEFVEKSTRYVNYAAFDSNNHVSKVSRKLVYTDYTPIRFSVDEPLRFGASASGTKDILGYIHADDCLDGDISDRITFSPNSTIDVYSPGEYSAELIVKNSAGDEAVLPVTVTIYDSFEESSAPKIELSQYIIYTTVGNPVDAKSVLKTVIWRGSEYTLTSGSGTFGLDTGEQFAEGGQTVSYDSFTIIDPVDYQTPGVYEVQYLLEDDSEHLGKVNLIVVVEEA